MDKTNKQYTPFIFTDNSSTGFVSFMECFEYWNDAAKIDPSLDLMEIFGMTWGELTEPFTRAGARVPPFFKGRGPAARTIRAKQMTALDGKDKLINEENKALLEKFQKMTVAEQEKTAKENPTLFNKATKSEAVEEFLELDFIGSIEGSMDCSGVCKSALFYWEKDIYHGFPEETCGYKMI